MRGPVRGDRRPYRPRARPGRPSSASTSASAATFVRSHEIQRQPRAGDLLLLGGSWAALDRNLDDPEVLVVDPPAPIRRSAALIAGMISLSTAMIESGAAEHLAAAIAGAAGRASCSSPWCCSPSSSGS